MCLAGNLNQLVPGSTKHNCVEIFDISRAGHDNFGRWGSRTEGIPILRLVNLPHQFLELGTEDIWFVIGLGSRASSKYTMVSVHTRCLESQMQGQARGGLNNQYPLIFPSDEDIS